MFSRLRKFVVRHKRIEEDAVGFSLGRLVWDLLIRVGFFGAGIASAATFAALSTTALPHVREYVVPRGLALPTATQKALVREGWRYGPGSGIVYVWGGNSPLGFDCSGYVNFVYRKVGISIPRNSRSQWTYGGTDVRKGQERPGDVVYFVGSTSGANAGPPPGHEGLYIGNGKFIQYYSGGKPAVVSRLRDFSDYMGAKRWYTPVRIPYRFRFTILWFARHFHVKVAHSHRYEVTFKPWVGHGKMALWRFRAIKRWAHHHEPFFSGNRSYVTIRF